MAAENKIGELYVDITGRDRGASAAIDKVKGKAEQATGSMTKLSEASGKAQSIISKLMMPVALATSIAGAVRLIIEFADESRRAKEELEKLGSALDGSLSALIQSRKEFSETTKEGIAFLNESRAASEAINKQYAEGLSWTEKITFALKGGRDENDAISQKAQEITDRYIEQGNAVSRTFISAQKILKTERDRAAAAAEAAEAAKDMAATLAATEARYTKIAELNEIILKANESQMSAADQTAAATLRQIDALTAALNAGPLQEGVAERAQAAIDAILDAQLKAGEKAHAARMKQEADEQAQRLRNLEDFDRAIRDSLAGGLFGGGAVAGGNVGAVASALGQIADKLGGAR